MIRLLVLPIACLVATIGYGAMLLGLEAPNAHTASAAPITWTPNTGSFIDAPTGAERRPSQAPAWVFQDGPALPVVNPYSGAFDTFPLR